MTFEDAAHDPRVAARQEDVIKSTYINSRLCTVDEGHPRSSEDARANERLARRPRRLSEAYTQTRTRTRHGSHSRRSRSSSLRSSKEKRHGSHQHGATKRCRAGVAAVIGIESRRIRLRVGVAHRARILEIVEAFSIGREIGFHARVVRLNDLMKQRKALGRRAVGVAAVSGELSLSVDEIDARLWNSPRRGTW